ncbi:hypothetical protein NBRC116188_26870 [Oceaniserpentilla sp. 4NH20-0058]|uniref:ExbD/TolR family protein n=1 Tax=Oceaniserpentilla sp. 4NH20-0058 TaxID=3127660 RepID=UPI003107CDE1
MSHHPAFSAHVRRAKPISLTALIDVVFILLMFFMLTSSFSQWQMLDLNLPSTHADSKKDLPPIVLVYDDELALLTDVITRPITLEQIGRALLTGKESQPLVISAEEAVPVNRLIQQYEQLKIMGFQHVQFGHVINNETQAAVK